MTDDGGSRDPSGERLPPRTPESGHERTGSTDRLGRRTFLRAAGASAVASTTLLAGCNTDRRRRYEAAPIGLVESADERGYDLVEASSTEVTRDVEAADVSMTVTLENHLARYDHEGTGFLDAVSVGLASSPAVEEAGVALNPLMNTSLEQLVGGERGERFLGGMGIGAGWRRGPTEVDTGRGTLLDERVEFGTFVGVTDEDEVALLNVARVDHDGDVLFVGDARTKRADGDGGPLVGGDGHVTPEAVERGAESFAEVLPLVVHGRVPGTGTTTGTDASTADTVPVYDVVGTGVGSERFEALVGELSERFGADPDLFAFDDGVVQYVDPERYRNVPTERVAAARDGTGDERPDSDSDPALDFAAIEAMPEPPDPDEVADRFADALQSADALPGPGEFPGEIEFGTRQTRMQVVDADGTERFDRRLDTAVDVNPTLEGRRLTGPGAKVHATFATVDGEPRLTEFRHAFLAVEEAGTVPVTGAASARSAYREELGLPPEAEIEELHAERVYFAPLPGRGNDNPRGEGEFEPSRLLPFYEVGGTVRQGEEPVVLMETCEPAVPEDRRPRVEVEATGEGDEVRASVSVEGGQPPYRVEWVSPDMVSVPSLDDGDPAELAFRVGGREPVEDTEVTASVVDADGVPASATTTVAVDVDARIRSPSDAGLTSGTAPMPAGRAAAGEPGTSTLRPGRPDFGLENGNLSYKKGVGKGFIREMRNDGVAESFSLWGKWAWERDFKAPHDQNWVDDTDLLYVCGHGNPGGWSFKDSSHDDGWFGRNDGGADWGDHDAEWLAVFSCGVMHPLDATAHERRAPHHTPAPAGKDVVCNSCGGQHLWERWGDNFDGLHAMLGFQAAVIYNIGTPTFGELFGRFLTDGLGPVSPLSVVRSWFLAIQCHQPQNKQDARGFSGRGRVLLPYGSGGRCPIDDHFWGRGPVGPDIYDGEIAGWITIGGG